MDSDNDAKVAEARRCSEVMRDFLSAFRARFEEQLRPSGITLAQLRLLKAVEEQPGASAASIARQCQVTPQTLQAMLARAVREGWITRGSSERNHRFVTAALTESGRSVLQQGVVLKERIEAVIWDGVPLSAVRALRETMEAGLGNLNAANPMPDPQRPHPSR